MQAAGGGVGVGGAVADVEEVGGRFAVVPRVLDVDDEAEVAAAGHQPPAQRRLDVEFQSPRRSRQRHHRVQQLPLRCC